MTEPSWHRFRPRGRQSIVLCVTDTIIYIYKLLFIEYRQSLSSITFTSNTLSVTCSVHSIASRPERRSPEFRRKGSHGIPTCSLHECQGWCHHRRRRSRHRPRQQPPWRRSPLHPPGRHPLCPSRHRRMPHHSSPSSRRWTKRWRPPDDAAPRAAFVAAAVRHWRLPPPWNDYLRS